MGISTVVLSFLRVTAKFQPCVIILQSSVSSQENGGLKRNTCFLPKSKFHYPFRIVFFKKFYFVEMTVFIPCQLYFFPSKKNVAASRVVILYNSDSLP
jgi:hypothetical protein